VRFRMASGVAPPAELGETRVRDGWVTLVPDDLVTGLHGLTGWALENRVDLEHLEVQRPTLEDIYLRLVGDEPAGSAGPNEEATPG